MNLFNNNREIYYKAQKIFGSMIFTFKDFLDQDYQALAENLNEKTIFSLHFEALKIWSFVYKDYFCEIFHGFFQVN